MLVARVQRAAPANPRLRAEQCDGGGKRQPHQQQLVERVESRLEHGADVALRALLGRRLVGRRRQHRRRLHGGADFSRRRVDTEHPGQREQPEGVVEGDRVDRHVAQQRRPAGLLAVLLVPAQLDVGPVPSASHHHWKPGRRVVADQQGAGRREPGGGPSVHDAGVEALGARALAGRAEEQRHGEEGGRGEGELQACLGRVHGRWDTPSGVDPAAPACSAPRATPRDSGGTRQVEARVARALCHP